MPALRRSIVLGTAVIPLWSGAAHAQRDQYARLITDALQRTATTWERRGFAPTGEVRVGNLLEREQDSLVLALHPDSQYVALARCDEDCRDLNLYLYDPAGKRLTVDVAANAEPYLTATPPVAGAYRLTVVMVRCSAEPCYFGLRLMSRAAGATPPP